MKKYAALLLFGAAGLYQSAHAQSTEDTSALTGATEEDQPSTTGTETSGEESQDPASEGTTTGNSTNETVGEEEQLPLEEVEEEVVEWVDVPAEQGPIEPQAISSEGWSGIDMTRCKVLQTKLHALLACPDTLQVVDKNNLMQNVRSVTFEGTAPKIKNVWSMFDSDEESFLVERTEGDFNVFYRFEAVGTADQEVALVWSFQTPLNPENPDYKYVTLGKHPRGEYAVIIKDDLFGWLLLDPQYPTGFSSEGAFKWKPQDGPILEFTFSEKYARFYIMDATFKWWRVYMDFTENRLFESEQTIPDIIHATQENESFKPSEIMEAGDWILLADPQFVSFVNPAAQGGLIGVYKSTESLQDLTMKLSIVGYPDDMYGEHMWFDSDNSQSQDSLTKNVLAVTHRENINAEGYDVDIFHIQESSSGNFILDIRSLNAIQGLSKASVESMTFKSGVFLWLDDEGSVQSLKICSPSQYFSAEFNACLPCTSPGDLNDGIFSTIFIQQTECQSCRTLIDGYPTYAFAQEIAKQQCGDDAATEKTTSEWLYILENQPEDFEEEVETDEYAFLDQLSWYQKPLQGTFWKKYYEICYEWAHFVTDYCYEWVQYGDGMIDDLNLEPHWLRYFIYAGVLVALSVLPFVLGLFCCCWPTKKKEVQELHDEEVSSPNKKSDINEEDFPPQDSEENFNPPNRMDSHKPDEERPAVQEQPIKAEEVEMQFNSQIQEADNNYAADAPIPNSDRQSEKSLDLKSMSVDNEKQPQNDEQEGQFMGIDLGAADDKKQWDDVADNGKDDDLVHRKTGLPPRPFAGPGGSNDFDEEGTDAKVDGDNDAPPSMDDSFTDSEV